jgi:F0F1-type ATP synthase gamma subunit
MKMVAAAKLRKAQEEAEKRQTLQSKNAKHNIEFN